MRTAAAAFVDDTFPGVEPNVSEELRPSLFLYLASVHYRAAEIR